MRPQELAEHGTKERYRQHCRCGACVEEMRRVWRVLHDMRKNSPIPDAVSHGTWNCYTNYGCRCAPCREACYTQREKQKAYREEHRAELAAKSRARYAKVKAQREREEAAARKRRLTR